MPAIPRVRCIARVFCSIFTLTAISCFAVDSPPVVIKVMTRNMDAGTDLNFVVGATDAASLAQGTAATFAEINASGFALRASRLADEIASQQPDLIGLQEVTLWRTGALSLQPTGVTGVLYDQLDLLMTELNKRQLHYGVIAVNQTTDVEAPVPSQNLNLRFTDRDVLLARNDFKQSDFDISNIQIRRYQIGLPLGAANPLFAGVTLFRGWISADVNVRGKAIRFVTTHLESTIPGIDATVLVQLGQVQELLANLDPKTPTVLLGDFNANAEPGPEHTGGVELILSAGFTDVWRALNPNDPGMTWPLFGEDQLTGKGFQPYERIDLIFERGLTPISIRRLSYGGFSGTAYPSDHVGVAAALQIN